MDVNRTLLRLRDTDLTVTPDADVRGRDVIDRHGEDIGHVDDLLVDAEHERVRFLQVAAGGFLGLGERKFLIPVDAVTEVEGDRVRVDQARERVIDAPRYDPEVVSEREYWGDLYGYYGYTPFWAPGYAAPAHPWV